MPHSSPPLTVEKPADIHLIELLCKVAQESLSANFREVHIDTNVGNNHLEDRNAGSPSGFLASPTWVKFKLDVLAKGFVSIVKVTIILIEPINNLHIFAEVKGIEAKIYLQQPDQFPPPARVMSFFEVALKHFKLFAPAGVDVPTADPRLQYYDSLAGRMAESVTRLQEVLSAESAKLIEQSKKQAEEAQVKIAAELKGLRDTFQVKEDALSSERKAFDEERRLFNDKKNTHVRRDLQKEMREEFENFREIKLSNATNRKTWPIYALFVVGLVGGAWIMMKIIEQITNPKDGSPVDWHTYAWLGGTTVFFIFLLIYFIRWNMQWLRQHASFEFRNIQYKYDMLRASWFAEMFFEYKDQGKALPESVIAVLTKNLFEIPTDNLGDAKHPVDDLVEFVKKLKTVKVSSDSVEVSTDKQEPKR